MDPSLFAGRIQDVVLDPSTAGMPGGRRYLAASDQGGLWLSTNDAETWQRIDQPDGFGQLAFHTVAFNPAFPLRAYASSPSDDIVPTRAGMYVSTDGGLTWGPAQDPDHLNHPQACDQDSTKRIAIDPTDPKTVYVAANCTVGISHNYGLTYDWVDPAPGSPGPDPNFPKNKFYFGMTVAPDGTAYTCGFNGIYRRTDDSTWRFWGQPAGGARDCDISWDPTASDTVFAAGHWSSLPTAQIFEVRRSPAGGSIRSLKAPTFSNGRPTDVQVRPLADGTFVLHYVNSAHLYWESCNPTAVPDCPQGPWTRILTPHADDTRLVFDPSTPDNCIVLDAGDGGFARPDSCDGTGTWTNANGKLQALQSYHMAGTRRFSPDVDADLYINTQDNGRFYRAFPEAPAWASGGGGDSLETSVDPSERTGTGIEIRMLFMDNSDGLQKAGRLYAGPTRLDPGTGNLPVTSRYCFDYVSAFPGEQKIAWFDNRSYVITARDGSNPYCQAGASTRLFWTGDEGAHWAPVGPPIYDPATRPAGWMDVRAPFRGNLPGTTPIFYVRSGGQLRRLSGLGSNAAMTNADIGLGSVGAFGMAESDPYHLYAFDCGRETPPCPFGRVVSSLDGGASWRPDRVLTRLIQADRFGNAHPIGRVLDALQEEPTTFAFDPFDDNLVAVGAKHVGALWSIDGGRSWGRLPVSLPEVTSFVFDTVHGHFYFSTYGRGVFEVQLGGTSVDIFGTLSGTAGTTAKWFAFAASMYGAALPNARVAFRLLDESGAIVASAAGRTDANGIAEVSATLPPLPGNYVLTAAIRSTATYLGSETQKNYRVTSP